MCTQDEAWGWLKFKSCVGTAYEWVVRYKRGFCNPIIQRFSRTARLLYFIPPSIFFSPRHNAPQMLTRFFFCISWYSASFKTCDYKWTIKLTSPHKEKIFSENQFSFGPLILNNCYIFVCKISKILYYFILAFNLTLEIIK